MRDASAHARSVVRDTLAISLGMDRVLEEIQFWESKTKKVTMSGGKKGNKSKSKYGYFKKTKTKPVKCSMYNRDC